MEESCNIETPEPELLPAPPAAPMLDLQIWEEIGNDLDQGIEKFAAKHSLNQNFVTAVAIVEAHNHSNLLRLSLQHHAGVLSFGYQPSVGKFLASLWRRKLQFLLSITVLVLLLAGIGAIGTRIISPERQVVVESEEGLPAYHKIALDETSVKALEVFHSTNTRDNFVGRYTLVPIPAGSVASERQLLSPKLTERMAGRTLLPISVKAERAPSSLKANSAISLAFVKDGRSCVVSDVILLGIEKHEASLTLIAAVPVAQFNEVAVLLVGSEIFVLSVPGE